MKIGPVNKIIALIALFYMTLSNIALAELTENPYLRSAIRNYNRSKYKAALYYFKKTLDQKPKEDERKAAQYAVDAISNRIAYLNKIEAESKSIETDNGETTAKARLAGDHKAFALSLMEGKFYLFLVEPHLKEAVKLQPDDPEAYSLLAGAYYSAMRYNKAVQNYEKVLKLTPGNLYAYKMAGDALVAMGDFDKAKKFYLDLIRANESAILRYESSEIEKINKVMKVLPETYKDVDILLKEERFDEAELVLKKRLSLNGADVIALTDLALIYQDRSDRKTALNLLKKAIKIAPDYPMSHFFLGRLYFVMMEYDKSISELNIFKDKIRLLPKMDKETKKAYINCLYYLSEVYFTLKEYKKAKIEIDEILKLDPKEQAAHYDLGIYYYKYEHSRSRAYQAFTRAIELDSSTDIAKSARYAIEFMRNNPDPRIVPDFSFINQEYRE